MIMEEPGSEATKRQRLDSTTAIRVHSQHPHHSGSPPADALHTYSDQPPTLAPPNAYADPVPPSPYHANEPRQFAEHPATGTYLPHSGYSTPVREAHALVVDRQSAYPRNGRDSSEVGHPGALRTAGPSFEPSGHVYPAATAQDADPSAVAHYATREPTTNGIYHGLPMSAHHDPSQSPAPGPVAQYAEVPPHSAGHAPHGGPPYSAGPYGPAQAPPWGGRQQQLMPPRKPSRALQVLPPPLKL